MSFLSGLLVPFSPPLSLSASSAFPPDSSVSPLNVDEVCRELASHPDQQQVAFVIQDIRYGFKLGFQSTHRLRRAKKNNPSALQHAKVVDEYLASEVALGKVASPYKSPPIPRLHVSSFGVIPKKGQPGKWRLIVDLSSLGGASVNDGIDPQLFTRQYITVDQNIRMVANYGPETLIAKFDVEAAYRNIAIHPDERFLLVMKWRGQFHMDLALPFGMRSAPFISNSVADMVQWILLNSHRVSELLHYLDDSITAGPPQSPLCAKNFSVGIAVCKR